MKVIGRLRRTAVSSSPQPMANDPSPLTAIVLTPGRPIAAPIDAASA